MNAPYCKICEFEIDTRGWSLPEITYVTGLVYGFQMALNCFSDFINAQSYSHI